MIEHYQPQILTKHREKEGKWLAPCAFRYRTDARTLAEAREALARVVQDSKESGADEIVATRIVYWQESEKQFIDEFEEAEK